MFETAEDQQLDQLLRQLLMPSTEAINNAQDALREVLKATGSIVRLLNFVRSHPEGAIRQVASSVLKFRITVHMIKFSPEDQEAIKQTLLEALVNEPIRTVRNSVASTVAHLAKSMVANGQGWPQLPQLIGQLIQDANPAAREVGFLLLEQLAEKAPMFIKGDIQAVAQMVMHGLHDNEVSVKAAAIKTANALLLDADDNATEVLQPFAGPIVQSLPVLVDQHTEVAVEALEVLQECVSRAVPVLNDQMQDLVPLLVQYMTGNDQELSLKQAANSLLIAVGEFRPKLLAKKGLINGLIEACFHMMSNGSNRAAAGALFNRGGDDAEEDDEEADDEDAEYACQNMAQVLLDQLALRVPVKHIYPACSTLCAQCMQSPEANLRRTAVAVIGVIAEGCRVPIQEDLGNILPALLNLIHDTDQGVRECLGFALGQLSEHCQPEILSYHEVVLPAAGELLMDPRHTVQASACYVLEQFIENLHPTSVMQYSQQFAHRLLEITQSPSLRTRGIALGALSSVAVCLEHDFTPYLADTVRVIEELLFVTEEVAFTLRGRALELLGHLAIAVGKEAFAPYVELGMRSCSQSVQLDDMDLQEFTHVFISNAAKVMGADFAPYLPELVPYLIDAASRSDVTSGVREDDDDLGRLGGEDEEQDEDDEFQYIDIRPTFINFKRSAITAIGALARHTGAAFITFLEDALNTVAQQRNCFHQYIRSEVNAAMPDLLSCAVDCYGPESVPGTAIIQLHQTVGGIVEKMMPLLLHSIKEDLDLMPVTHALAAVEEILKLVGRAALSTCQDDLMNLLLVALQGQLDSQKILLEDDHEPEEDEEDSEEDFMNALHDLIGVLAKRMGPDFVPYFDVFFPHVLQHFRPNRPWIERAIAIGCLAEVAEGITSNIAKYQAEIVPAIVLCLGDEMAGVRRNASFCAGMFCSALGAAVAPHVVTLLQALHAVCQRRTQTAESAAADTDNALAAVGRMIVAAPDAVPLSHVLPVFFANLPLTSDVGEYPAVLQCIGFLLQSNTADVLAHVPAILGVIAHVVHPSTTELPEALKMEGVNLLQLLAQSQPQLVQEAFAQIPEDARQLLGQHMQH